LLLCGSNKEQQQQRTQKTMMPISIFVLCSFFSAKERVRESDRWREMKTKTKRRQLALSLYRCPFPAMPHGQCVIIMQQARGHDFGFV